VLCFFRIRGPVFGFLVMVGCVGVRGCYGQWLIWNQGWLWFGFVVGFYDGLDGSVVETVWR
jgi:hypothetical protein